MNKYMYFELQYNNPELVEASHTQQWQDIHSLAENSNVLIIIRHYSGEIANSRSSRLHSSYGNGLPVCECIL